MCEVSVSRRSLYEKTSTPMQVFMRYGKCKFESRCSYIHRVAECYEDMKNQLEYLSNEIAVLKAQNDVMHREILKLQN